MRSDSMRPNDESDAVLPTNVGTVLPNRNLANARPSSREHPLPIPTLDVGPRSRRFGSDSISEPGLSKQPALRGSGIRFQTPIAGCDSRSAAGHPAGENSQRNIAASRQRQSQDHRTESPRGGVQTIGIHESPDQLTSDFSRTSCLAASSLATVTERIQSPSQQQKRQAN